MTFIFRQKINFILDIFLEILQRYCEIIVLGTLVMPDYTNIKWYYQFVENFCLFAGKKTTSPPSPLSFSGDITKICKLMLGTLVMPGCTYPKWYYQFADDLNVYLHAKKNFSINFFLEIYILKNPAISLADSILAHNSRTRILPDMGLAVKYQQY